MGRIESKLLLCLLFYSLCRCSCFSQQELHCYIYFERDSVSLSASNELILEAYIGKTDSVINGLFCIVSTHDSTASSFAVAQKRNSKVAGLLKELGFKSLTKLVCNSEFEDRTEIYLTAAQMRVYHKTDYFKIGKFEIAFDTIYRLNVKIEREFQHRNFIKGKDTVLIQQQQKEGFTEKDKELREKILSAPASRKEIILLPNILFEGGTSKILKDSFKTLELLASVMKEKPSLKIKILGHVCCAPKGRDGLNEESGRRNLSSARARSVYNFLIRFGIDKKRLKYKGMKANYKTGKGAHFDRRVEIIILEN